MSLRGREGLGRGINRRWQGKCCPFNALYIMNKISPMHLLIESVKAHDKVTLPPNRQKPSPTPTASRPSPRTSLMDSSTS